jgi:hypothetical protein
MANLLQDIGNGFKKIMFAPVIQTTAVFSKRKAYDLQSKIMPGSPIFTMREMGRQQRGQRIFGAALATYGAGAAIFGGGGGASGAGGAGGALDTGKLSLFYRPSGLPLTGGGGGGTSTAALVAGGGGSSLATGTSFLSGFKTLTDSLKNLMPGAPDMRDAVSSLTPAGGGDNQISIESPQGNDPTQLPLGDLAGISPIDAAANGATGGLAALAIPALAVGGLAFVLWKFRK